MGAGAGLELQQENDENRKRKCLEEDPVLDVGLGPSWPPFATGKGNNL